MKILAISDLHIGDGSKADDFGHRGRDHQFISWVKSFKADMIIVVGDLYELWQFKSQAIRNAHYILVKYIENNCYHIRGNHDYQLMGPLSKKITTKSGKKILFSHGFQNDKMMTSPFTRLAIWGITWLERILPWIDNDNSYKKNRKKSRIQKYTKRYADKMLKRYDIVVCGHTHRQGVTSKDGKVYANCGTCVNHRQEGILINTLTDTVIPV